MNNTICPICKATNRLTARFCTACGHPLPLSPPTPFAPFTTAVKSYLAQAKALLVALWAQAVQEAQALYAQLRGEPQVEGTVITAPYETAATQVYQFYFALLPVSSQTQQVPMLSFRVNDRARGSVEVMVVGNRQGTPPVQGDAVRAWGTWDTRLGGLRAWRVQTRQRAVQPVDLQLTAPRPLPLAVISVALLALLVACCLLGTCWR
ncbi:MAG: hypothetical protein ACETWR_13200 [Anaerolineae bacterium]